MEQSEENIEKIIKERFGNKQIGNQLKTLFADWIDNGHNNFEDKNTCILQIKLTDGALFSSGTKYDIDFTK